MDRQTKQGDPLEPERHHPMVTSPGRRAMWVSVKGVRLH